MLRKRLLTALWGLPLLVAVIWFDVPLPWFTVFVAIWGILACLEFYRLAGLADFPWPTWFGVVWAVLFILQPHFPYGYLVPLLLASAIVFSWLLTFLSARGEGLFTRWVWAVSGIFYVGWLLSYLVALRLEAGRGWVFLALFTTFASDTAAYFVGKAIGKHRMAPRISPGKTWEGAIGAVCGAAVGSVILAVFFHLSLSYVEAILLGVLVSVFGQLGDLVESLIKRTAGVKESGNLLPGHGGLLDRMDSVVFAGVVVYLFYIFR